MSHPCLECGACCATWPVQFVRAELTPALRPHVVPAATKRHVVLRGTEADSPRCHALTGDVGVRCRCTLYADRPSPCREVQPSLEFGRPDSSCEEARRRHGLPRLRFSDWL